MEGSPYRKFSISRGKGAILGPGPENSITGNRGSFQRGSWEPRFLPAGILGTRVPSSGDPKAGVLPGVRRNSIPEYFSPTVYPLLLDFVIELGDNLCTQVNRISPISDRDLVLLGPLILVEDGKLWASDDVLEMVEPGSSGFLKVFCSAFMKKGTVMMKPRNSLPRVASSSWCVGTSLGFITLLSASCRLAAFQLSYSLSFSVVFIRSSSVLHFSDLTVVVESPSHGVIDLAPPSAEEGEFPPVGPLLSIGVDKVANWRAKYHLSDDVVIRIPGPIDRVSDFKVDEVPVYEGFFESGFRDRVPSLVAKVSEALEISYGQLNPSSWRTLIALLNLGDLEGLTIGVAEVLYSYAITQLNGGEWRYHLHPRGGEHPVQEIAKKDRKRVPAFDGRWIEKFAFMYLPGFSTVWCTAGIPSVDPSLGEKTIKQVLELSIERRQVPFLVSKEALERCSIWGNMSGSKGEEALAEYKKALEVMSSKKAAPKKTAPSENDDEVQFIKSNKSQDATTLASSTKKKSRALGSTPRVSPSSSSDPATVLGNLNTKVFPLAPVILPEGDSSASIQIIQGDLLQAMSQLFHLGERMGDHASLKADLAELAFQLREEKDKVLAKEKEIKALKLKVRNQDEAGALAAAENVSLREQLEQREEEVCDLRCAAETFDTERLWR
ncbi:hypothetical protein DY000_02039779 [Brassica cretica]|uniref:Aminotransferase-like plant mobile domain-containing protein n=1 Tax=Brassica cretica TaxID=69181 RepID=A0ABQ7BB27_BRACR|nr:hypothetical protein DY000_02039779 [Brassica cretica]